MKPYYLLPIVFFFSRIVLLSAQCPPGSITFSSQAEIDAFPATGCTAIAGNLIVTGADIANLNGLSSLTTVSGYIQIESNPMLSDLGGLANLTSFPGGIAIKYNAALVTLSGLPALAAYPATQIVGNDVLISLDGLATVASFSSFLVIDANPALVNLNGLNMATSVGGFLRIDFNENLENLDALEALSSVGAFLQISNCPALTSLSGLHSLTTIGGQLQISNLPALTTLYGLDNIAPSSITNLILILSPSLSTCEVASICSYLGSGGSATIFANATGCDSQAEVQSACPCTWDGSDGNWSDATRWLCGHAPGMADNVFINGGSVVLDVADVSVASLNMSGGSLGGNNNLSVIGDFQWSGGTLSGAGNLNVAGSTLFTGTGTLDTRRLLMNGGGSAFSNATRTVSNGGEINIPDATTFTVAADANWGSDTGGGLLSIEGTLLKQGGGFQNFAGWAVNCTGSVQVAGGNLYFGFDGFDGAWNGADISVVAGGNFYVSGGIHTFNNCLFTGDGTIGLSGAGPFESPGATLVLQAGNTIDGVGIQMSYGTINANQVLVLNDDLILDGGTFNGAGNITLNGNLNILGGTFSGSGSVMLNGSLNLLAGILAGTGDMNVQGIATFVSGMLDTRRLMLNGGGAMPAGASLQGANDCEITLPATQTLTMQAGAEFSGSGLLTIEGAVVTEAPGGSAIGWTVNCTGSVAVNGGDFYVGGLTGAWNGVPISVADGGAFFVTGGTHIFNNCTISGSGSSVGTAYGGNLVLEAGNTVASAIVNQGFPGLEGIFTTNQPLALPHLTLSAGTINGTGIITVNGNFDWTGGTLGGATDMHVAGVTNVSGNVTLDARHLYLNGGSSVAIYTQFTGTNEAELVVPSGQTLSLHGTVFHNLLPGGAALNVQGTLTTELGNVLHWGMNCTGCSVAITGDGDALHLASAEYFNGVWSGAVVNMHPYAALYLTSGVYAWSNCTVTGGNFYMTPSVAFPGTPVLFLETGNIINTYLNASGESNSNSVATLVVNQDITFNYLTLGAFAQLTGTGDITVNGSFLWAGAALTGTGDIQVEGVTTFGNAYFVELGINRKLTMNGGAMLSSVNQFSAFGGGEIVVPATETFDIHGFFTMTNCTLKTDGVTEVWGEFSNEGTIKGNGAVWNINGGFDTSMGHLAPGSSPGVLVVGGNYANDSGNLNIEIGGTIVGTEYDRLVVTGTAALSDGNINLSLVNGYTPQVGHSFTILDAASLTGTFAAPSNPFVFEGYNWEIIYDEIEGTVTLNVIPSLLPIELIDFQAFAEKTAIRLAWRSAAETNFSHYEIERSADGANWSKLGELAGSGSPDHEHTYQFTDSQPISFAYYRLRMVDLDGSEEFSALVWAKWQARDIRMRISPNPFFNKIDLQFDATEPETAVFSLTDATGRVLWQTNSDIKAGENRLHFDIPVLPKGVYFLIAQTQEWMIAERVMKW